MSLAALFVLAILDAACAGYRAAAGRNALVRKQEYFARAALRGAVAGLGVLAVAAALALAVASATADRAGLERDVRVFTSRLLAVYAPFALVIGLAFLVRIVPSVDLRTLTSAIVFGPLSLLRPFVAVGGLLWAAAPGPTSPVTAVGAFVVASMLSLERLLAPGRFRYGTPHRTVPR